MTDSTSIALVDARSIAVELASSSWAPKGMSKADVLGAVLTGRELGLGPMASLRSIHVIEGRPSLSSAAMLSLAQAAGYRIEWERADAEAAVLLVYSPGVERPFREAWTMERARAAGLGSRGPWRSYPEAMLRARSISSALRAVCPGVALGLYTPEEVQDLAQEARPAPAPVVVTEEPSRPSSAPPVAPPAIVDAAFEEAPRHHASWEADRRRFCARLREMGATYDEVAGLLATMGKPRPSAMEQAKRDGVIQWLAGKGAPVLAAWRAEQAKTQEPAPDPAGEEE